MMRIIIDTNVIFSSLLKNDSIFRDTLLSNNNYKFMSSNLMIIELFKYKDKISRYSQLQEPDLLSLFYQLLNKIELCNDDIISQKNFISAYELCRDIDPKDTIFVALTLEFEGLLWTTDKKLKEGLLNKGFNSFFND